MNRSSVVLDESAKREGNRLGFFVRFVVKEEDGVDASVVLDESVSKRMMAHMKHQWCWTRVWNEKALVLDSSQGLHRCVSGAGREYVKQDDGAHEASVVLDESAKQEGARLGFFAEFVVKEDDGVDEPLVVLDESVSKRRMV
jgi:hypothetical protein